jgi:hypothetical protein
VLHRYRLGLLGLLLANAFAAQAATISFSGNFAQDDDVKFFDFFIPNPGSVTVSTTSYAANGFQTVLTVFDSSSHLFLFDSTAYGSAGDSTLVWPSPGGEFFILALTQYGNVSPGPSYFLEDGFKEQGNGNYTADVPYNNFTAGGSFLNPGGEQRTSFWSLEFTSADPALYVSPEPSTFVLFAGGTAALILWRRRRIGV